MLKQLERMFGKDAGSPLLFSSHRWGEQPLTSGNGGGAGGGHDAMGHPQLRRAFVSRCNNAAHLISFSYEHGMLSFGEQPYIVFVP